MPNPVGLIDTVDGADIDILIIKNRREEFLNMRFHGAGRLNSGALVLLRMSDHLHVTAM